LETQISRCLAKASQEGMSLDKETGIFIDYAQSGLKEDRSSFVNLMYRIQAEEFATLIINDLARHCRDQNKLAVILRRLTSLSVGIISIRDFINTAKKWTWTKGGLTV